MTPLPPSRTEREQLAALPYRCPRCFVRYPLPTYVCRGGWPNSNLRGGTAEHASVRVALIPTPRTP